MKKAKKLLVLGAAVAVIGVFASVTAFAASQYDSPAEAAAALTERTVESVIEEKSETGKTYGAIAKEAGALDEFKAEVLEMKKDAIAEKVSEGTITQEKADEIIAAIEARQENCDGTGTGSIGKANKGFGKGTGMGQRDGTCTGANQRRGQGNKRGNGIGLGDGSCNN